MWGAAGRTNAQKIQTIFNKFVGGSARSDGVVVDEAELQRHQQLERLYNTTKSAKLLEVTHKLQRHQQLERLYNTTKSAKAELQRHQQLKRLCNTTKSAKVVRVTVTVPSGSEEGEDVWVVSLDFITGLPSTSRGHDSILVVIDKFSKMGHFIPTNATATAEATARLFFDRIITIHGIPATLISDRDPKFTSKFWKELMGLLGTKLAMSSAYHPQTDGQTERLNQVVEQSAKVGRNHHNGTAPAGASTAAAAAGAGVGVWEIGLWTTESDKPEWTGRSCSGTSSWTGMTVRHQWWGEESSSGVVVDEAELPTPSLPPPPPFTSGFVPCIARPPLHFQHEVVKGIEVIMNANLKAHSFPPPFSGLVPCIARPPQHFQCEVVKGIERIINANLNAHSFPSPFAPLYFWLCPVPHCDPHPSAQLFPPTCSPLISRPPQHFQREMVKGIEGIINANLKHIESIAKLSEECRKYGAPESPGGSTVLGRAALHFGAAHSAIEKERDNMDRTLGTQVRL
ncbi:unnamed protein product [Closterium sp. NIES-53]